MRFLCSIHDIMLIYFLRSALFNPNLEELFLSSFHVWERAKGTAESPTAILN